ncbi:TPA: ParA family protein [Vibrio vulnificus]|nr:ParA family protein [Vibrio vulnificus]
MSSGKVITVMNMKGGVGKTTVTAHLGSLIAKDSAFQKYKKVLMIDFDPQFNLSQTMLAPGDYFNHIKNSKCVEHILTDMVKAPNPLEVPCPMADAPPQPSDVVVNILNEKDCKLDIVLANLELMYIALGSGDSNLAKMAARFKAFVDESRKHYDLIFIDCHPSGSLFTKSAIENSDHIVIPVTQHAFAARGVKLMQDFIKNIAHQPHKKHLLFNAVHGDPTTIKSEILSERDFKGLDLKADMPNNPLFKKLSNGQSFLWENSTNASYQLAYLSLSTIASDLIAKIEAK